MSNDVSKVLMIGEGFKNNVSGVELFNKSGFEATVAEFDVDNLLKCGFNQYDAVIVDCIEVERNPVDYLKNVFKRDAVPVIIISSDNDIFNQIISLEMGADDYIVKPYDNRVLLARTKVAMRREYRNRRAEEREIIYEGLYINHSRYIVEVEGTQINMPAKEFELLYLLASNPHKVFTRRELLEHVWGFDFGGKSRTIDVHIKRLRNKIERENLPWSIDTVWSVGYKFDVRD